MNASGDCTDRSFGPGVEDCNRKFDFTLAFEESILSVVPSIVFLVLAPIRIIQLKWRRGRVSGQSFKLTKLCTISIFAAQELALLILCSVYTPQRTLLAILASALSLIDAIVLTVLSGQEHSKSLRPSALIGSYLFLSLLFDAVRVRTLWLIQNGGPIRILFTVSVMTKLVILVLEAREKRQYLNVNDNHKSPEETSGLFNQGIFWWLNRLIRNGFSKVLLLEDLYQIDESMSVKIVGRKFQQIWSSSRKETKYRLIFTLVKVLKWQIIAPVLPRICLIGFTFCQPLLLNRFLRYLQDPTESSSIGYGLLGAYGIVYFGLAISTGFYWYWVYRWITMIRGSLVSAIYHKTTQISTTVLDNSAAVTLMSTDVERIELGLKYFHELWATIIQIGLATWLLQRELGLACLAPVFIACLSAFTTSMVAKTAGKKQTIWVEAIQKRVGITSTMLNNMRGVKMTGLTPKLSEFIQKLRVRELMSMKSFRIVLIYCVVLAFVPQQISPILAFGTFIGISDGHPLDTTRLFTSVSLLVLLNQPLLQVFSLFPSFMASISCLNRIEGYLSAESRIDFRLPKDSIYVDEEVYRSMSEKGNATRVTACNSELKDKTETQSHQQHHQDGQDLIVVRNGSFGWKQGGPPVLQNFNINIKHSKLTIIIGPIACGKSTLLKGLLGETPNFQGVVEVSTRDFSFCDQTPWLTQNTIQKNIIGFSRLNPEWYDAVLYGCALNEDILSFPLGDQTLVGSNGNTLSGGQKQRLAIARAVYSNKMVAIFDDVFSGLDSTTERQIFDRLFGRTGILRSNGTTVIVATHAVNLLPWADHVVALDSTCRIVEEGSFSDLNDVEGSYVQSLALKEDSGESLKDLNSSQVLPKLNVKMSNIVEDATADKARQMGDLSVYKYYFAATGGMAMAIFWFLEIAWSFLETFPTVWLNWWSSAITMGRAPSTAKYLGVYAALNVGSLIAIGILAAHVFNIMQVRSGAKLHLTTLTTVMEAPSTFFGATDSGAILNRFSQDIQLIDGELPNALLDVVGFFFNAIGQAVLIASASWYIAISFPFLLAVFYLLQKYYLRTSRQLRFMDLEAKSPLYTQFIETLSGLATIRAFGWQVQNHELNDELLDMSQRPVYLLYMVQRWLTLVLDLISWGLALLVVGLSLKFKSSANAGFTGIALVNIMSLAQTIKWVVIQWTQLETAIGAVSRTKSFEAATVSENLPCEISEPPVNWPSKGTIEFKDLSISYKPEIGQNVIKNFNLTIQGGEKIGICGRSGSGKSSLVLALFRMIEISNGTIFFDELDISIIPRQEVRARLNASPQDPYFLHGTIRLNMDPWEVHSDERIIDALNKVELWKMVQDKGGLEADIEIELLSHGQRQLFCLARAILRPGKIVVLDEVTSSVDRKTDELMQRIIRTEFANCTIIAVAHRLETILDFDRIVVLENGKMGECDTPAKLLATNPAFRELFEMYEKKEKSSAEDISVAANKE